jgi:hypothetical protein
VAVHLPHRRQGSQTWETYARPMWDGVPRDLFFTVEEADRATVEELISAVGLRPRVPRPGPAGSDPRRVSAARPGVRHAQVTLEIDLRDELLQQHGYVHGGVITYAADRRADLRQRWCSRSGGATGGFTIDYLVPARELTLQAALRSSGLAAARRLADATSTSSMMTARSRTAPPRKAESWRYDRLRGPQSSPSLSVACGTLPLRPELSTQADKAVALPRFCSSEVLMLLEASARQDMIERQTARTCPGEQSTPDSRSYVSRDAHDLAGRERMECTLGPNRGRRRVRTYHFLAETHRLDEFHRLGTAGEQRLGTEVAIDAADLPERQLSANDRACLQGGHGRPRAGRPCLARKNAAARPAMPPPGTTPPIGVCPSVGDRGRLQFGCGRPTCRPCSPVPTPPRCQIVTQPRSRSVGEVVPHQRVDEGAAAIDEKGVTRLVSQLSQVPDDIALEQRRVPLERLLQRAAPLPAPRCSPAIRSTSWP